MTLLGKHKRANNIPHTETIINGEKWPSVTEIVGLLNKPWKESWQRRVGFEEADRISTEAINLGTNVHGMIDTFCSEGQLKSCGYTEQEKKLFDSWFDWIHKTDFVIAARELKLINQKDKYAGTFDAILINEKTSDWVLTDWKVSNSDDHTRILQLAGYAKAYLEQEKRRLKKGMIVRIDKKGKIHVTKINNLWKYVPLFLSLRKLYDFVNKKGKYNKVK